MAMEQRQQLAPPGPCCHITAATRHQPQPGMSKARTPAVRAEHAQTASICHRRLPLLPALQQLVVGCRPCLPSSTSTLNSPPQRRQQQAVVGSSTHPE
eukprot:4728866-Amphidinium_carterae.1